MSAIDKAARLAAAEKEKQERLRERAARLDPRFPFVVIPCDPAFFGVALLEATKAVT
jgi:hypothetical protein